MTTAPAVFESLPAWAAHRRALGAVPGGLGFVPTMGALHAGHGELLKRARRECGRVALSIFVNPAQFNDPGDLARYPRTLAADLALARDCGVDDVLVPSPGAMYPRGYALRVQPAEDFEDARVLEGEHRPGHFAGMLTVVLKLLQLVDPDRVYLGEKDYQQLVLVRAMAREYHLRAEIIGCPTVREPDGLAMSSRNRQLAPELRARAAALPLALRESPTPGVAAARLREAGFEVEYVAERWGRRLAAARLGEVRLIDNVPALGEP